MFPQGWKGGVRGAYTWYIKIRWLVAKTIELLFYTNSTHEFIHKAATQTVSASAQRLWVRQQHLHHRWPQQRGLHGRRGVRLPVKYQPVEFSESDVARPWKAWVCCVGRLPVCCRWGPLLLLWLLSVALLQAACFVVMFLNSLFSVLSLRVCVSAYT